MTERKSTPPGPDPKPGRNPGYPEQQPRDKGDAGQPHRRKRNPDEGGLDRDPDSPPADH